MATFSKEIQMSNIKNSQKFTSELTVVDTSHNTLGCGANIVTLDNSVTNYSMAVDLNALSLNMTDNVNSASYTVSSLIVSANPGNSAEVDASIPGLTLTDSNGNSLIFSTPAQTTVNGSMSGNIVFSQPFSGSSYKKIVCYLTNLVGTATVTFPVPFTHLPAYMTNSDGLQSSITVYNTNYINLLGTNSTGVITLEGF